MVMKRTGTLLLLTVFTLLFAGSLDRISFHEGYRLDTSGLDGAVQGGGSLEGDHRAFMLVLWTGVAAAAVSVIVSLFTADGRKRLLLATALVVGAVFLLGLIAERMPELSPPLAERDEELDPTAGSGLGALDPTQDISREPRPEPGDAPAALGYALSAVLAIAAAVIVYRTTMRRTDEHGESRETPDAADELAGWARRTREQLGSHDLSLDAVQHAYFDLESTARNRLGTVRAPSVTARQFTDELATHGVPRKALETLVTLFEHSRYGTAPVSTRAVHSARNALSTIVDALDSRGDAS